MIEASRSGLPVDLSQVSHLIFNIPFSCYSKYVISFAHSWLWKFRYMHYYMPRLAYSLSLIGTQSIPWIASFYERRWTFLVMSVGVILMVIKVLSSWISIFSLLTNWAGHRANRMRMRVTRISCLILCFWKSGCKFFATWQIPTPPGAGSADGFELVTASDVSMSEEVSGDRDSVYKRLQEELVNQIKVRPVEICFPWYPFFWQPTIVTSTWKLPCPQSEFAAIEALFTYLC